MTDDYYDSFTDDELGAEVELEPYEEILDEWEELGWFDVLPTGLMTITRSFADLTAPRVDFDAAETDPEIELLDGDPLWAIMSADLPEEHRVANHEEAYGDYLASVTEQRRLWSELVERQPDLSVTSVNELVDLLIRLGLLATQDGQLELVDKVPDPLEILQLDEAIISRVIINRMAPEMEAVEEVLHELLYHGTQDQLAITLSKLAQQAEVTAEIARLTVAMLISDPDSGITADRFGPLDEEALEQLKEHQKFTLVLDRTAPGFSDHGHD